jgi:hypothetical protein
MPAGGEENPVRALSSLTVTDSMGRYTLENVPAGRYFISAGNIDVPTFYPATLDITKATAVSITSANPKVDFNITLQNASAGLAAPRGNRMRGVQGIPPTPPNFAFPNNIPPNIAFPNNIPPNVALPNIPNAPFPPVQVSPFAPQQRGVNLNRGVVRLTLQPGAAWWTNAALVRQLGISDDQKKKIELVFEQYRATLIQNKADLEKEEATLARMLEADPLESPKLISAQIDRVVLERGGMERTNSRMTLDMRQVLTRQQWMQLQSVLPTPVMAPEPGRPVQIQRENAADRILRAREALPPRQ